jgi:hypothetical protein
VNSTEFGDKLRCTHDRSLPCYPPLIAALGFALTAAAASHDFQVVVYGGTAGGVIAAVAAAREGLHTALLEPTAHVGGMVSGGLGSTDVGKKEVIARINALNTSREGMFSNRSDEQSRAGNSHSLTPYASGCCPGFRHRQMDRLPGATAWSKTPLALFWRYFSATQDHRPQG